MKMSSIELGPQAPPHPPLGALLVQYGYIRQEDIDTILEYQSAQRIRFGEAAIRLGLVSVENVRFALSRQFEFAYLRPGREGSQISAEVVSACDPFSGAADQIRSIRSQLMLHWFDKLQGRNALAILGAVEGEGRSYLAANLAVAFAQAGENVLLVDANFRAPRQHTLFGIQNDIGLSAILAGHRHSEAILRVSELSGLFLLPAGALPPNPLELLTRASWQDFLVRARSNFDMLIVDTPALRCGEDAVFAAVKTGAALLVARTGITPVKALANAARVLTRARVPVVGTIWNHVADGSPAHLGGD